MVGLGTIFIAVMAAGGAGLWRGALYRLAPDALGADAHAAVPLHRHHRRLDDRRSGPPAVADLRPDAHRRRILRRTSRPATRCSRCSASWECTRCWPSSSSSWSTARNRTDGPGAGARSEDRLMETTLVLPRRRHARRLRGAGRLRPRRRHHAPVRRAHRRGAPGRARLDRPGLGRQRGLAARRAAARSTSPSRRSTRPASAASICR